jgi:hypothetical protein
VSTRCQIGIYNSNKSYLSCPDILIYRHSKGYPDGDSGVVADLMPFLRAFKKNRGLSDWSYLGAWLLYHLIGQYDNFIGVPQDCKCLGYGIEFPGTKGLHGDIEYFYFIAPDVLRVYKVDGEADWKWSMIEEHKID